MADKAFRVLLDLTELCIENLKYVWVNVSPLELKTISDFKASILQKINLESSEIDIFVREGLLLDRETIIVLREDDTVKVLYKELSSSAGDAKVQKKCVKKRNYSECASDVVMDLKRCKTDSAVSDKTNEIVVRKKKRKKSHSATVSIASHYASLEESNYNIEEKSEKRDKKELEVEENIIDDGNINQNCDNLANNVICQPKASEKDDSNLIKQQKKKDKKKSDVMENSADNHDFIENCESFFSFVNVKSTVKQHENESSGITTVEPDNLNNDLNKSLENSNDFSEVSKDIKMSLVTSNNCSKKKRKRRRKRKNTVSAVIDILQDSDADKFISFSNDVEEIKVPQQMLQCTASKVLHHPDAENKFISFSNDEKNVKRKHIIYSNLPCDADKIPAEICDDIKEIHNSSNDTYIVNEDISAGNIPSFKDYPKISTPNQSNKCRNLSWHVSLMQNKHSVTNNESQNSEKKNIENTTRDLSFLKGNTSKGEKKSSQIQYEDVPDLNSFPEVGTHIVYKVLEMDDCYCPVVSEYREGIVKGVNQNTQEMEIELLKEVIKPGRTGKFENLKDDENPLPEIIKYETVLWSSVIAPKRLT